MYSADTSRQDLIDINVPEEDRNLIDERIVEIIPETGIFGSSALLCATTLGAGILGTPLIFSFLGIPFGFATLVFFAFCTMYSIHLLLVSGKAAKAKSYESLMEAAFPKFGKLLTTIFIDIFILGALVGFLLIIANNVDGVVKFFIKEKPQTFLLNKNFLMGIIALGIVFPLSLMKDISKLEYSSVAAIAIIGTTTLVIVIKSLKLVSSGLVDWSFISATAPTFSNVFKATPIASLAYTCQTSIFPIWKELHRPTLPRMNRVQIISTTLSGFLYCVMGFFGFVLTAPQTSGNVLLDLPDDDVFVLVIRICFTLAIVFHYPVVHFAFRESIEVTFFNKNTPVYRFSWVRHVAETLVVLVAAGAIGIALGELSKVFDLTGSIAGYPIDFIFPAMCYGKIMFYDGQSDSTDRASRHDDPVMVKMKRLLTVHMILPFLMFFLALVSAVISLYESVLELI